MKTVVVGAVTAGHPSPPPDYHFLLPKTQHHQMALGYTNLGHRNVGINLEHRLVVGQRRPKVVQRGVCGGPPNQRLDVRRIQLQRCRGVCHHLVPLLKRQVACLSFQLVQCMCVKGLKLPV